MSAHVDIDEEAHRDFCLECMPLVDWCRSCGDRSLYTDQVPNITRQLASTSWFSVAMRIHDSEVTSSSSAASASAFAITLDPRSTAATTATLVLNHSTVNAYACRGSGCGVAVVTRGYEFARTTVSEAGGRGVVDVVVTGCEFTRLKTGSAAWGGGMAIHIADAARATVVVRDTRFHECSSAVGGGGVSLRFVGASVHPKQASLGLSASVDVRTSVFASNSAGGGGGGLYAYAAGAVATSVDIAGCTFTGNIGDSGGGMDLATGSVIDSVWPSLPVNSRNNVFGDNSVKSGGGGAARVTRAAIVSNDDVFRQNYGGPNGGHVFMSEHSSGVFARAQFDRGNAAFGGSIMVRQSTATMSWCTFEGSQGYVAAQHGCHFVSLASGTHKRGCGVRGTGTLVVL